MKESRFSKLASWLTAVGFFLLLLAMMILTLLKEPPTFSYYENRNLNPAPTLTKAGMMDGSYFTAAEEYLRDRAAAREPLLRANTYLDLKVLSRPVVNDVLVSGEKVLAFHDYEAVDLPLYQQQAEDFAKILKGHIDATEEYGGNYFYLQIPSQSIVYAEDYPFFLNNSAETDIAQAEIMAEQMAAAGATCIDMRKEDWKAEYLSVVDHHYLLPGILHTYETLLEKINDTTDLSLKPLKEGEDYMIETLENPHIGSRSRKLMGLFKTEEKISYAKPKEPIPFERFDNGVKVDPIINSLPQTAEQEVAYGMYMGGDIAASCIDTHREELPSILIYGDSFTNGMESILWQNFDTTYTYDLRHYNTRSLEECIRMYQPDIVVYIRNHSGILEIESNLK